MKRAWLAPAALLLVACSNTQLSSLSATQSLTATTSPVPTATPTSAAPEVLHTLPITLTSTDQRFSVDAGNYSVDWSVAGAGTNCHFAIVATNVATQDIARLIDANVVDQAPVKGTTDFAAVAGEYKLQAPTYDEPCSRQWSATIKQK